MFYNDVERLTNDLNRKSKNSFTSNVTGLTPNTIYYVRAYATNNVGTAYGNQENFITLTSIPLTIGDNYGGGKVAYILQAGDPGYVSGQSHGIIAAPTDQSLNIQWFNGVYFAVGAYGLTLGTGNANTNTIVTEQGTGSYAAKLCYDLVLNGYNDWYLPSQDELNQLYINRTAIGGFAMQVYWSSSEFGINNTWYQSFLSGFQGFDWKYGEQHVRAVRAF